MLVLLPIGSGKIIVLPLVFDYLTSYWRVPPTALMNDRVQKYCHYLSSAYKYGEEQNDKSIIDGV